MYTTIYNATDKLNAQRQFFPVDDRPVVIRWSGLDAPVSLMTNLSALPNCARSLDNFVPYVAGVCATLGAVEFVGSGSMVVADPGNYAVVAGAVLPTTGMVSMDQISFEQARLILAGEANAIACASTSAVCPPLVGGIQTDW